MAKSTSAKPAVNDPIEGSKLEQQKPPDAPPADAAAAPAPTPPNPPDDGDPALKDAPEVPPPPPPPPEVKTKKYRVKNRTTVSLFGQIVVLPEGDIISAASYGDIGMQRIIDSKVPLEELP